MPAIQATFSSWRKFAGLIPALILLVVFSLFSSPVCAQQPDSVWVRYFGEYGSSIGMDIEIVDDGVVVTGTKSVVAGMEPLPALWLLKVDFDGNLIWEREFGDNHVQKGYALAKTPDGGFVISGTWWTNRVPNAYVVKTDSEGNLEWEHVYPTEDDTFARDIEPTPDGGYVVTGATQRHGIQHRLQIDAFVLKLDANGNQQWARTYGGGWENDETWSIDVLADGYVIAGRTWSGDAQMRDAVIAKIDLQGNVLWHTIYGGQYKDHIYEFQTLPDGTGFIATGKTESFGNGFLNHGDIWLLRFDQNGQFMWRTTIGHEPTEFGRSVDILANGDYIVTGLTITQENNNQVFVGRSDPNGNWLWSYDLGFPGMDDAWCVRVLPDGDYIIAGLTQSMGVPAQSLLLFRMTDQVR